MARPRPRDYTRPHARHAMTTCSCGPVRDVVARGSSASSSCGAGCAAGTGVSARERRRMNALATHVGDGRWVVETPRPVAEADKVFTVPAPSMMPAGIPAGAPAVWSRDGAWVAPVPGTVPGTAPSSGFGAPSMQVPSEAWFEGAGEFAEVPESDDHGGCGATEASVRVHETRCWVSVFREGTPEDDLCASRRPGRCGC